VKIKMSSIKITLSCLALATHLFSINNVAASEADLSSERKEQLNHIVKQDCGSCHGMTLKGGLGPALLPEDLKGKTVLFLQHTILHGRAGTAMPPWKTLLTEQEALWISQQLKAGRVTEK
jgi:cytochrome c55X